MAELLLKPAGISPEIYSPLLLLRLNRYFPGRPAVLRRLVVVFEQLRDIGKAAAFLKAYARAVPHDPWASEKRERFAALGFR